MKKANPGRLVRQALFCNLQIPLVFSGSRKGFSCQPTLKIGSTHGVGSGGAAAFRFWLRAGRDRRAKKGGDFFWAFLFPLGKVFILVKIS